MTVRIIPRLDVKGNNVIKGIQMEGLRIVGDPKKIISHYYNCGADEIAFFDVVASLYEKNNLLNLISEIAQAAFIPLTVTGGIRSLEDALKTIEYGADKIGLNTAAFKNPDIISEIANVLGNQAVVVSIEARKVSSTSWEAYTESGREPTGYDVKDWVKRVSVLGVGEISVTSVDRDGTQKGPDIQLIQELRASTELPLVVGGGISSVSDVLECVKNGVDGILIGTALHKNKIAIAECKQVLTEAGYVVRIA